ncbi:hypothetical protein QOT17_021717 [Balamuthia mandrillaris]
MEGKGWLFQDLCEAHPALWKRAQSKAKAQVGNPADGHLYSIWTALHNAHAEELKYRHCMSELAASSSSQALHSASTSSAAASALPHPPPKDANHPCFSSYVSWKGVLALDAADLQSKRERAEELSRCTECMLGNVGTAALQGLWTTFSSPPSSSPRGPSAGSITQLLHGDAPCAEELQTLESSLKDYDIAGMLQANQRWIAHFRRSRPELKTCFETEDEALQLDLAFRYREAKQRRKEAVQCHTEKRHNDVWQSFLHCLKQRGTDAEHESDKVERCSVELGRVMEERAKDSWDEFSGFRKMMNQE